MKNNPLTFYDAHTHHEKKDAIINLPADNIRMKNHYDYSIGLHPWSIPCDETEQKTLLKNIFIHAGNPSVIAVGETGLDHLKGPSVKVQKEIFLSHLKIAKEHKKPVIIHNVKADHEIFLILKQSSGIPAFMFHRFNGKQEQIRQFARFNTYFSLAPDILKNKKKFHDIVCTIAPDKLLFESDDFETGFEETVRKAASFLNVSENQLAKQIKKNFLKFAGLKDKSIKKT